MGARKDDIESMFKEKEKARKGFVDTVVIDPQEAAEVQVNSNKDSSKSNATKIVKPVEKKTKQKTILLQQSVHDQAAELCNKIGVTMNEAINQLLINWIHEESN